MDSNKIIDILKKINFRQTNKDIIESNIVTSVLIKDNDVCFSINVIDQDHVYYQELEKICKSEINKIYPKCNVKIVLTGNLEKKSKVNIEKVSKIIAISSCKGGVGKSTIAINLAKLLAEQGKKIGFLDLDIYGPSASAMLEINQKPEIKDNKINPIEKYGVHTVSFSYLISEDQAVIWRGPMLTKALNQLLMQTNWPELDFLILDLPPGTGDIHLSLFSNYQIDYVILVSTPHFLSISDLKKTIDMYQKLDINILGIINNMIYFLDENGNKKYIFGTDDNIKELAARYNLKIIAQLPIDDNLSNFSFFSDKVTQNNLLQVLNFVV